MATPPTNASWWPFLNLIERSPNTIRGHAHDLKDWFAFHSPTWASADSVGSRPAQVVARR